MQLDKCNNRENVLYICILTKCLQFLCLSGDVINKYYFPVFIPVGIVGNILSFLVSFNIT